MKATIFSSALAALFILALTGCTRGIPEFQYFDAAYGLQAETGDEVMDRLAVSERILRRCQLDEIPGIPEFDPDLAAYYLKVGDPPLTQAIRGSLQSVTAFNAALSGLATGEAASALSARIGSATTSLSGAGAAFGAAAGLPQAGAVAELAGAAIGRLLPLFRQLAALEDRAQFRALLLQAYPDIRELLLALRAGTATIFAVHKEAYKTPGSLGAGTDGVLAEDLPDLERERELLASWVVLLDRTLAAMDTAVAAVRDGGGSADVAALVDAGVELQALADTLSALRTTDRRVQ